MKKINFIALIIATFTLQFVNAQNRTLNFDGVDDYVNLDPIAPYLDGINTYTIEFWMKAPEVVIGQPAMFAINEITQENGLLILIKPSGTLDIQDITNDYPTNVVIADNTCHHIAFSRNSESANIYVDGNLVMTIDNIQFTPHIYSAYSIGQEYDLGGITGTSFIPSNFYTGEMDDLIIWRTARTQAEIQNDMNNPPVGTPAGLVSYYNFDQGTAGGNNNSIPNLTSTLGFPNLDGDFNGFSLNGPISNFIENSCDPEPNTVLNFDGTNDYVNLDALSATFVNNSSFSIEFLMKYDGVSAVDVPPALFSINNSTHDWNGLLFLVNSDGTLRLDDNVPGSNTQNTYYSSTVIDDGECHYISYTTDGSNSSLYIDGVFQFNFSPTYTFNMADKISLGQEWDGFSGGINAGVTSNFFNGDMDRIRIWNTTRTQNEILSNMNNELTGGEANLVALYNCNQGIAAGNNTLITDLTNSTPSIGLDGPLNNFDLIGPSTNFIENSCNPYPNTVLNFDGTNDYVDLDVLSATFVNNSSFSIEFLMKYNGVSAVDVPPALFSINNSTHDWNGLLFLVNSDGTLRLDDNVPGSNTQNTYYSSTIINDGVCHYISYTTDGSNSSLYIDGVFQFNFSPTYTFNMADKISLGQEWDGFSGGINAGVTSNFFNGDMDRIRIWNTTRTQNEVSSYMNIEMTGGEANLVALYNCNQGIAAGNNTSITDLTNSTPSIGLDGPLNNFDLIGASTNFIENSCDSTNSIFEKELTRLEDDLLIYPNPSSTTINIDLSLNNRNLIIQIFDLTGKLITNYEVLGNTQLDIQNLKTGIYLITVTSQMDGTVRKGKFVKMN